MERWYDEVGLTEEGAKRAVRALPLLLEALAIMESEESAQRVWAEAKFRVFELPKRRKDFQTRYLRDAADAVAAFEVARKKEP